MASKTFSHRLGKCRRRDVIRATYNHLGENDFPLPHKTKAIKNDKGKEGVIKWEKWVNVVDGWLYQIPLGRWSIQKNEVMIEVEILVCIPWRPRGFQLACLFNCPGAKKTSSRMSHIKKVQQQNLPHQKSPVAESPTSKKSSTKMSHIKKA